MALVLLHWNTGFKNIILCDGRTVTHGFIQFSQKVNGLGEGTDKHRDSMYSSKKLFTLRIQSKIIKVLKEIYKIHTGDVIRCHIICLKYVLIGDRSNKYF
jgi:hypothetical protein